MGFAHFIPLLLAVGVFHLLRSRSPLGAEFVQRAFPSACQPGSPVHEHIQKYTPHLCRPYQKAMAAPSHLGGHRQLMIPGPIEVAEDVLAAAGGMAMSHTDPRFINDFGEALELVRKVFLAEASQPFIVAGSGTLGWDMVGANLVEPGESVLVVNTGYFGDRFAESLEAYGAVVTHVRAPAVGGRPSLDAIAGALKAAPAPFKAVTITHVDTSTGVLTDVEAIAKLVKQHSPSSLVVVDGVCSVGGEVLRVDAWGVDVALTGSQKALGAPPGLSIVVASQAAMKVLEQRTAPVASYYASWRKWLPVMKGYEARAPSYFATPAVQLIQALRVSLKQILAATPDMAGRFAKHAAVSDRVKAVVGSWGLRTVPASQEVAAHTMTAVFLPEGMAATELLPKITARGVMVAGGLHPAIAPKYFRIGHMGISAMEDDRGHIDNVLRVVKEALVEAGYKMPEGAL